MQKPATMVVGFRLGPVGDMSGHAQESAYGLEAHFTMAFKLVLHRF